MKMIGTVLMTLTQIGVFLIASPLMLIQLIMGLGVATLGATMANMLVQLWLANLLGDSGLVSGVIRMGVFVLLYLVAWVTVAVLWAQMHRLDTLFRKDRGHSEGQEPHDRVVVDGPVKTLRSPLYHFTYDNLADMLSGLDSKYQASAVWLMSPSAVGTLRKFKDDESLPLWQPAMAAGEPPTLFGRPIYVDRHLGAVATGGTSVVVMGPSTFAIRFGGGGIRVDRSDDAFFSSDEVGFRTVVATDSNYLDTAGAVRFVGGTA
jgi:hypothetical protein